VDKAHVLQLDLDGLHTMDFRVGTIHAVQSFVLSFDGVVLI